MKKLLLIICLLYLILLEIFRVYFIMPFPGSQRNETIELAYWLHSNIGWMRLIGWIVCGVLLFQLVRTRMRGALLLSATGLLLYAIVFYFFNFRMLADKMFLQPTEKIFANRSNNKIPEDKLVIGVILNGISKAYPIQVIGYHHQVRDTIGTTPVMVTYCTVCRTGRVFSPLVNGQPEEFRLVGMDHFNAMFEDSKTGSWWRQATGEAITGPLKGASLTEIPSQQTSLAAWITANPSTQIMQYDTAFVKDYEDLADFDNGTIKSNLEKRDSASWRFKSWVIGIHTKQQSKAYDWNELVQRGYIQDSLPDLPLLILLEKDTVSFHVFNRIVGTQPLTFTWNPETEELLDQLTGSVWNLKGDCISGPLVGMKLTRVQAYQEFWHSWQTFHPDTKRYPE
jgi:hypothetical protein